MAGTGMRTTGGGTLVRVSDLYPPEAPEGFIDHLHTLATPERDEYGNFILRRALTADEREALSHRRTELARWFVTARQHDLAETVNEMMIGFAAPAKSEHEAGAEASAYAVALAGLPLWAVKRACMRFACNDVKDEELGEGQAWSRTYGPSQAHLVTVAREIARRHGEEYRRIEMTLKGTAERKREPTPEERARGMTATANWLKRSGASRKDEAEAEAQRRKSRDAHDKHAEEGAQRLVLEEYRRAGVEPPKPSKDGLIPSLSTLLTLGCTIIEVPGGGRAVSIPPNPYVPPAPRDARAEEDHRRTLKGMKEASRGAVDVARETMKRRAGAGEA